MRRVRKCSMHITTQAKHAYKHGAVDVTLLIDLYHISFAARLIASAERYHLTSVGRPNFGESLMLSIYTVSGCV